MYSGPFYYHQPGYNQHGRAFELLGHGIGDGVIVPVKTTQKAIKKNFDKFIANCRTSSGDVLFDTEDWKPENIDSHDPQLKSQILLEDVTALEKYISTSLEFQHQNGCTAYILPSFEAQAVNMNWFRTITRLSEGGRNWIAKNGNQEYPAFLTVAIPSTHIIDQNSCQDLLDNLTHLKPYVNGFYINLIEIPEILVNESLFYNILSLVFKLKWQKFDVVFSKAGAWIETLFPVGLNTFGNDGFKSQQQVHSLREIQKTPSRRGGPSFVNIWSPLTLSYIRYPDDAQKLHKKLSVEDRNHLYGSRSGFSPPIDKSPDEVMALKSYKQPSRLNHYSASMAYLARDYRGLTLNDRITLVQKNLRLAFRKEQEIGNILGNAQRGQEKEMWFKVFTNFVNDNRDDLDELFN